MVDKSVNITIDGEVIGGESEAANALSRVTQTNPDLGRLRLAQVNRVDTASKTLEINVLGDHVKKTVPYFGLMTHNENGTGFWYGLSAGDYVYCSIGPDNKYCIVNKIGSGVSSFQKTGISTNDTNKLFFSSTFEAADTDLKNLSSGGFLLKCENDIKLKLYPDMGAFLGKKGSGSIFFDNTTINNSQGGSITLEANQNYSFNYAGYSLNGVILRDTRRSDLDPTNDPNTNERLISQWYKNLSPVNFDPTLKSAEQTKGTKKRNPNLVEKREVVYEYADYWYDNPVQSDEKESQKQDPNSEKANVDKTTSRRIRAEDTFSLSLVSPNYLIEQIKGTAVDIFGNILDLNRTALPIGKEDGFTTLEGNEESYLNLRKLHRRGLVYHWELNARKDPEDLNIETGTGNEYALVDGIYKRNRSRFFFDVDKEGQFKLNVPSSSEFGNVSVLARYENYTTINPHESGEDINYDYFKREKDVAVDVLLDAFGNGVVSLAGNERSLPKDRTDNNIIKVGTAFHDISTTCVTPLVTSDPRNPTGILSGPDTIVQDQGSTRNILAHTSSDSIVTKEINISGENANAGGRSGTIVCDGMLNLSVGANTVDRQSIWLDTAGGIVQRVGADLNGISVATQTDGDVYLQVGGQLVGDGEGDPDKRFSDAGSIDTALKTNRFEIRVMEGNGPTYTRILIDNEGIIICSPKNIELRSEEDLILTAGGNIFLNAEKSVFYGQTIIDDTKRLSRQSRTFDDVYEADEGARPVERAGDRRTV